MARQPILCMHCNENKWITVQSRNRARWEDNFKIFQKASICYVIFNNFEQRQILRKCVKYCFCFTISSHRSVSQKVQSLWVHCCVPKDQGDRRPRLVSVLSCILSLSSSAVCPYFIFRCTDLCGLPCIVHWGTRLRRVMPANYTLDSQVSHFQCVFIPLLSLLLFLYLSKIISRIYMEKGEKRNIYFCPRRNF